MESFVKQKYLSVEGTLKSYSFQNTGKLTVELSTWFSSNYFILI